MKVGGVFAAAAVVTFCALCLAKGRSGDGPGLREPWLWTVRTPGRPSSVIRPAAAEGWVPFVDVNHDGMYDPFIDYIGYCTPVGCRVPRVGIEIQRSTTIDASGETKSGILIMARGTLGDSLGAGAKDNSARVCTRGACSVRTEGLFPEHRDAMEALWLCADPDASTGPEAGEDLVALGQRTPLPVSEFQRVVVRPTREATRYRVVTTLPSDLLSARIVRAAEEAEDQRYAGEALWTTETFEKVDSTTSDLVVPPDSELHCPTCVLMVQAEHRWRNDWVNDRSVGVMVLALGTPEVAAVGTRD